DWTAGVTADEALTGQTMPVSHADVLSGTAPEHSQPDARLGVTDAGESARSSDDEWIVLAEETWLRWLDWEQPTETRVGARLEPKIWAQIDPEEDASGLRDP